ncbi:hypothetical protein CQW23_23316 [Capsicum baccatum]|uniref:Cytochrome n=1 Tax=Capsicum baccatum TaxID=33114 RepID=A0A2G2VRM4_CAPBA|nr:hypothetical protein CQW23_23316 [Capsicum baccatum]
MSDVHQEVRSRVLSIINKRMNDIEANGEASNSCDDLLGILLESNLNKIQEHGNKKFGMSIDEVIEESRAREKVLQVFGNNIPDYDKLNQLKVVTMIIQEALRLYPPSFLLGREVNKETKLGNLSIPSGVQLLLPTILLRHDQEIWGEDAKEFNPERFSEESTKQQKGNFHIFHLAGDLEIALHKTLLC